MTSTSTKIGHTLAKCLGIKLEYRNETGQDVSRGESVFSISSADTYVESEPTTAEWFREVLPGRQGVVNYFLSIFPFINWIGRYNLQWLIGDLIAGITIGAVVVPQSMAYAKLAELLPQFGLYSAFMGVTIYWFFATSKDITIGPVAVMSTLVGTIVLAGKEPGSGVEQYEKWQVAGCLSVISGAIIAFLGLARLGFIVDFISATAVSAFITGAALNIAVGQVCNLLGVDTDIVDTHASTYKVIIGTLKYLYTANITAAIGMTALFSLYLWRFTCNQLAKKYPKHAKLFFIISTLRTAVVILFYTLVSYLANRHRPYPQSDDPIFAILGTVPRGFQDAFVPIVNKTIIEFFASKLPATVIVLLIEHIAIAKSFGRINNYTINPSQELLAIGVTNLLGPFLGAYPATGSFSRTAIKSKAGVRTPLAGIFTAIVVLLAIYALPPLFYWIPTSALSAVIIHAVGDLIMPPNTVYQFWRVSPFEVLIFFVGVIVTVFSSIEDGIYTTVSISAAILLWRLAKARGRFLGKVKVHSVVGDHVANTEGGQGYKGDYNVSEKKFNKASSDTSDDSYGRTVFLPLNHMDGSNPSVELEKPYPGIFIYRFSEGFNYPNSNHYLDHLASTVMTECRRTNEFTYARPGDRPWNDPGPRRGQTEVIDHSKPTLKAIILDFSSVNNIDVTVCQNLIDVRNQLDRFGSPEPVEWHICNINNRWTKRALVSSGFGYPTPEDASGDFHRWKPVYSVAEFGGKSSAAAAAELDYNQQRKSEADPESGIRPVSSGGEGARIAALHDMNRPFFHIDIQSALTSAITSIERRQEFRQQHIAPEKLGSEEQAQ